MKFKKTDLLEVLYDDHEVIKKIRDTLIDTSRWSEHHELIFEKDGKLYSTSYSRGATEQQDESPFEYDPDEIECTEVEAYEKTVTEYREVKKA